MAETKTDSTKSLWVQAIAGGAFTLIPARKYPAWLRHSLVWGSTAGIFTLIAVPGALAKLQELTPDGAESQQPGPDNVEAEAADVRSVRVDDSDVPRARMEKVDASNADMPEVASNPVVRIGLATAVAACTYGLCRFSFWFDAAAESGLRKLRVPYPRVVMGIGVGGSYWATEKFEQHMNARTPRSPHSDAR